MNISDLAIDIASISDLKDLPLKIVKLTDELTERIEQAQEKIEIDLGGAVVSIFHRNCPYKLDAGELKSGWHYLLTTYSKDGASLGPALHAEDTAIDQIAQYLRKRKQEFSDDIQKTKLI